MLYSLKLTMFVFLVAAILFESCYTKVYSDDRLAINPSFLSLFNSVIQKDTIRFSSSKGRSKIFVITKVDSVISNRKGLMMNQRPYKMLEVRFREIGKDTVHLERENEIFVIKDPEALSTGITIHFNNLRSWDTLLPLRHDTLNVNDKKFTGYYLFETSLRLKNPDDVKVLYIKVPKGILGFRTFSGEVWVNEIQ